MAYYLRNCLIKNDIKLSSFSANNYFRCFLLRLCEAVIGTVLSSLRVMNKNHNWLSFFAEILIEFIHTNEVVEYNRHGTVLKKIRAGFALKLLRITLMNGDFGLRASSEIQLD